MSDISWVKKYGKSFMDFPLKGLKFKKCAWTVGDHQHCLFCGKEFTNDEYDYETAKQGYRSTTDCWWACSECFNEFTKEHKIPVEKNTVQMIKDALTEHKTVVISLNNEQYFIKNNGKITVEHNGSIKEYDSILSMEREQMFYGKPIREAIDEIYLGIID